MKFRLPMSKRTNPLCWHTWFAWYPVVATVGRRQRFLVWLQPVHRYQDGFGGAWNYRVPPEKEGEMKTTDFMSSPDR